MTKRILFFLLALILINPVFSDQNADLSGNCDTTSHFANGNKPFVTMYGDSLGDFVNAESHGIFGWNSYLGSDRPDINWDVQNLAIAGWTSVTIFDSILYCANYDRTNFKTSNHAAFEMGGNDVVYVIVPLIIFPWKVYSYTDPLTGLEVTGVVDQVLHNVKANIRLLRHPMMDKDVLVIGNFPGLSYSPSLGGNIGFYFNPIMDFNNQYTGRYYAMSLRQTTEQLTVILKEMYLFFNSSLSIIYSILSGRNIFIDTASPPKELPMALKQYSNTAQGWYVNWVTTMWENPSTVLSMTLGLMQVGLERTVNEQNDSTQRFLQNRKNANVVSFLPMYAEFIHWPDCIDHGQCWVGNPLFFRDPYPSHINTLGYRIWSSRMSNKIAELGWDQDTTLRMSGLVNNGNLSGKLIPDTTANKVVVNPSPIDWLLLFCILTGKCW